MSGRELKIQYPILIEKGDDNTAWGIVVPDLPGCFSAADSEVDILENAREAIVLHLESLNTIPEPSPIDKVKKRGFITSLVDVDISTLAGPAKRINVTIPAGLLARIDAAAKSAGKARSAFLTEAALRAIER